MHNNEIRDKFVFLVIPLLLLIPCILTFVHPDKNAARIELRKIQEFPSIPTNLRELYLWPKATDRYIIDHFFMRSLFIREISKLLYFCHISISKEVLIGKDGWLFLSTNNDVIDKHRGIKNLSPEEADTWMNIMSSRVRFLKERGIDCWFIIIPNKHSIYPEYLPDWCTKVAPSLTDTLVQKLKEQGEIHWIDLRPLLIEAAKTFAVYGKYNSHWDDMGAYLAYKYIMKKLPGPLNLSPIFEENVRFTYKRMSGDLARLINLQNYLTEEKVVAEITKSRVIKKTEVKDYQKESWTTVTSNRSARAVILCDSFVYSYMQKYLQESFSYSFFKHHNHMDFDKEMILQQHPDIVLYIIVERLIPLRLVE